MHGRRWQARGGLSWLRTPKGVVVKRLLSLIGVTKSHPESRHRMSADP